MAADEAPWDELAALFDDSWYVDCDIDVAMQRVYERQVRRLRHAGFTVPTLAETEIIVQAGRHARLGNPTCATTSSSAPSCQARDLNNSCCCNSAAATRWRHRALRHLLQAHCTLSSPSASGNAAAETERQLHHAAMQVGDGRDPDTVRARIGSNDRPNAELIQASSRHRAAVIVPSLPFKAGAVEAKLKSER